jgi:hypothetical protein
VAPSDFFKLHPYSDPLHDLFFPPFQLPGRSHHYSFAHLLEAAAMDTIPPLAGAEGLATGTPPIQLLDSFFPGFSGMSDRTILILDTGAQPTHT